MLNGETFFCGQAPDRAACYHQCACVVPEDWPRETSKDKDGERKEKNCYYLEIINVCKLPMRINKQLEVVTNFNKSCPENEIPFLITIKPTK